MAGQHNDLEHDSVKFRSGAAARLAGIPVETLRVWERRYAVVGPRLSARGQRLYSVADVRRLSLIKQLVDAGNSIGAIAALPLDALIAVRSEIGTLPPMPAALSDAARATRVVLVGPALSGRQFEQTLSAAAVEVVGRTMHISDAPRSLRDLQADAALIELSTLNDESADVIANLQRVCRLDRVIVLYRFAPSAVIRKLRKTGYEVARAPADTSEVAALCLSLLPRPAAVQITATSPATLAQLPPPPRLDEQALSELANASTTVYCECPRHLVDLVISLGSFERYSAECANRGPADAAIHRDLELTAGRARAALEEALIRVARAEGMSLPASVGAYP
jgi:hypothetical protein